MLGQAGPGRPEGRGPDGRRAIQSFIDALGVIDGFAVDEPADPAGEWWIDLTVDGVVVNVAWRPDKGFGIYSSDEAAYGSGPDEVFRSSERAAKRLLQLLKSSAVRGRPSRMRLKDIRQLVDEKQASVASRMHMGQSVVSRLEGQNDALLSTVNRYVEALGGKMKVVVCFDDFEVPIEMPEEEETAIAEPGHSA